MGDYFDLRVHDLVALDEIELYAEVLSAVAVAERPLTVAELDQVLGVQPMAGASASPARRGIGRPQTPLRATVPQTGP